MNEDEKLVAPEAQPEPAPEAQPEPEVFAATVVPTPGSEVERLRFEEMRKKNFSSLVLVLVFSLINIPMMLFAHSTFLFSLAGTQLITEFAFQVDQTGKIVGLRDTSIVLALVAICVLVVALYCVLLVASRKTSVTLYVALVLFIADTVLLFGVMLLSMDFTMLLNVAFHAWILYSFIALIRAQHQLKLRRMENHAG